MSIHQLSVQVPTFDGQLPAYYWAGGESEGAPGIVLLMEAYGLTPHILDVGERLAREGFKVIAPDLYHRQFPDTTFRYEERPAAMEAMEAIDVRLAVKDAVGAMAYLRIEQNVEVMSAVGLCFGGSLILPLCSEVGDELSAGVSFYGHCSGEWLAWANSKIESPLLFFYGMADAVFRPPEVDALEAKLKSLDKDCSILRLPNAGHAYMNPARKEYNQEAAEQSWDAMSRFLWQKTLPSRLADTRALVDHKSPQSKSASTFISN